MYIHNRRQEIDFWEGERGGGRGGVGQRQRDRQTDRQTDRESERQRQRFLSQCSRLINPIDFPNAVQKIVRDRALDRAVSDSERHSSRELLAIALLSYGGVETRAVN